MIFKNLVLCSRLALVEEFVLRICNLVFLGTSISWRPGRCDVTSAGSQMT